MCNQLKIGQPLMLLVVVGTLLGSTITIAAEDVIFSDANLEEAVRESLNIAALTPITVTNMESLTDRLPAHNLNISNIQGLQHATNLNELWLQNNLISDISAVSGLTNLQCLYLSQNQISDISAVSGLTNLTNLSFMQNEISDISAISKLTNMKGLSFETNNISDISAVSGLMNLNNLCLTRNNISDISVLSGLINMSHLSFGFNYISDISAVYGLTDLEELDLRNNQVSDLSAISGMTKLRYLDLDNNMIGTLNLSGSALSSLQYFNIAGNPLAEVLLVDATLSQTTLDALMGGGSCNGIAELDGVLNLDMSGVDFANISDLSTMNTMDDLETFLLVNASNLDGSKLVTLTSELDSLNWLDVTGLWDSFDAGSKNSLNAWDAVEGNTLIIPEPASLSLLALGGLALIRRNRKRISQVLVISLCLFIGFASAEAAVWTETFDEGVGRLSQTNGPGDSYFTWDANSHAIDGYFWRGPTYERYAPLDNTYVVSQSVLGFSTIVTPLSANQSSGAAIGFFSSDNVNSDNRFTVVFGNSKDLGLVFFDGVAERSNGYLTYSFGTTYFVDALLDGPNDMFKVDLYEGTDNTGSLVGSLSTSLGAVGMVELDALGINNRLSYTTPYQIPFHARIEEISLTISEPLLEGDANRDGVVSAADYAAIQAYFGFIGEAGMPGDANLDGVVSAGDYASVQANFGNISPTTSIPEPTMLSILAFCGLAFLRRKK
jgi:hypothetical protein